MNGTAVMELWKALEPVEHKKIVKFLENSLNNQREDVRLLAGLLANTQPEAYPQLDKRAVFQAIFPHQTYNNLQLNYTCSFLAQRIEAYFVWAEMESEAFWRDYLLGRAFRRRGIHSNYLRKMDKAIAHLDQQPLRNSLYHLIRYLTERERYEYQVLYDRETPTDLTRVTEPLLHFFTLENLRWAGTSLSLKARYGVQNEWPLSGPVLAHAAQASASETPEIVLMHLGYETLKDVENEENFKSLKALISANDHVFNAGEKRDIYLLAINFCLRRHNRGERPFYTREALELYREALKRDLFIENNHLQKYTYNNIVRLACLAGEWEWAKDFLETYQSRLAEEERENIYKFNLASWHYLSGNYSRVPALLQAFEYTDRDTQLNARQMLLRSFFELEEWQALDSLLLSFYFFLRRRHDIGYQRLSYLNLIKYTRKLMSGTPSRSRAAVLRKRIEKEEYVAEREWLLEKLNG
jgi:hypothetical protein